MPSQYSSLNKVKSPAKVRRGWGVPADGESPRSRGAAPGRKIQHYLDEPAGVCYCFSEVLGGPGSRFSSTASERSFGGRGTGRSQFTRNENEVKPLKANNPAKCPDFALQ